MKIAERYATARHTSNLRSDPRTRMSASDVLTASGMAAHDNEAALLLWGIAYQGKTGDIHRLVELMTGPMGGRMARFNIRGNTGDAVRACIAWWLSHCPACNGTGHEIIPHTITRSDDPCGTCQGTGKLPMPNDEAFRWLASELDRLQSIAGGKVMQKLAISMDF